MQSVLLHLLLTLEYYNPPLTDARWGLGKLKEAPGVGRDSHPGVLTPSFLGHTGCSLECNTTPLPRWSTCGRSLSPGHRPVAGAAAFSCSDPSAGAAPSHRNWQTLSALAVLRRAGPAFVWSNGEPENGVG